MHIRLPSYVLPRILFYDFLKVFIFVEEVFVLILQNYKVDLDKYLMKKHV